MIATDSGRLASLEREKDTELDLFRLRIEFPMQQFERELKTMPDEYSWAFSHVHELLKQVINELVFLHDKTRSEVCGTRV